MCYLSICKSQVIIRVQEALLRSALGPRSFISCRAVVAMLRWALLIFTSVEASGAWSVLLYAFLFLAYEWFCLCVYCNGNTM